ncbi:MAG: hypothetical protein WDK96_02910 [Candidatus Paceibacterota bacterium]|jgi:hypothetical protein
MDKSKKLILIVEDKRDKWEMFFDVLKDAAELTFVPNEILAMDFFNNNYEKISLIGMDACLGGDNPNTMSMTRKMRSKFDGPIVATSSSGKYNSELLLAGASHFIMKDDAPEFIKKLLKQNFKCETIPCYQGMSLNQSFLEFSLELLQNCLSPTGIKKTEAQIKKLEEITELWDNDLVRTKVDSVKKELKKLDNIGQNDVQKAFNKDYVDQVTILRDLLLDNIK